MKYPLAERFKAPQGEGDYAGTPMAFIRLVGCSVGQTVCTHCDTEFDRMREYLGGGLYDIDDLLEWVGDYKHVCVTGGEPLDRDLRELIAECQKREIRVHIETSGTKLPVWMEPWVVSPDDVPWNVWITVSPKPGYLNTMLVLADEIKVIIGGLGNGHGWPTLQDAVRWEVTMQKHVYIQPRNNVKTVDQDALSIVLRMLNENPQLKLSVQLHKFIGTR